MIPRARFEDGGKYTCKVMKLTGKQNVDIRSIVLVLEGTELLSHMFYPQCLRIKKRLCFMI